VEEGHQGKTKHEVDRGNDVGLLHSKGLRNGLRSAGNLEREERSYDVFGHKAELRRRED